MRILYTNILKLSLWLAIAFSLMACSNIIEQIKEKNREDYILSTPGAYDPVVPDKPNYLTHEFNFLEKYRISHDWPYGFDVCHYSAMILPKSQGNGTWYGSYRRLGDMFEYKGETFQEASVVGYPKGSRTSSSIDNHVRTWKKVDSLGVERTYGYKPICSQSLLGSSQSIYISLYSSEPKWLKKIVAKTSKDDLEKYFFKEKINGMEWLVRRKKYRESEPNRYGFDIERWILKIKDTDYYYSFSFLANKESLRHPQMHAKMKKIFRHLIESVKIEALSKEEAAIASVKVKKLISEIEKYEARRTGTRK